MLLTLAWIKGLGVLGRYGESGAIKVLLILGDWAWTKSSELQDLVKAELIGLGSTFSSSS